MLTRLEQDALWGLPRYQPLMLLLGQAHDAQLLIARVTYTMPSVCLLLQTTRAVMSSVTVMGSMMKGQRTLLGGS